MAFISIQYPINAYEKVFDGIYYTYIEVYEDLFGTIFYATEVALLALPVSLRKYDLEQKELNPSCSTRLDLCES